MLQATSIRAILSARHTISFKDMEEKKLNLEIKPEIAKGTYSNLAIISHSRSEFIIDFAEMLPGMQRPDISNRLVMTPDHAKMLLNALAENITKYENQFGRIELPGQQGGATFNISDFNPNGPRS